MPIEQPAARRKCIALGELLRDGTGRNSGVVD